MVELSKEEQNFLRRVISATAADLKALKLDPVKPEDLLIIVNKYRAGGYMISRRLDGGKESDLWRSIRNKLNSPVKSQAELIKIAEQSHLDGVLIRVTEAHDKKINALEDSLILARKAKVDSQLSIEFDLKEQLRILEAKKLDTINRLTAATSARKKLALDKDIRKIDEERKALLEERNGERKCWICGEWFKIAGGVFTKHTKECKKDKEKNLNK